MSASLHACTAMTTIYHNPRCGTSRTVLQTLQERGIQPEIIEYLDTPLSRSQLATLIDAAGLTVREAMRSKEAIFQELKLDDPALDDEQLLDRKSVGEGKRVSGREDQGGP